MFQGTRYNKRQDEAKAVSEDGDRLNTQFSFLEREGSRGAAFNASGGFALSEYSLMMVLRDHL
jgi:hypothetical protein